MTRKMITRALPCMLLIAGLSACSNPMIHDQKAHPLLESLSFELIDTRKAGDKHARWEERDALYFYGDNDTRPGKIDLLKHTLEFQLGERLYDSEVKLNLFEISNYYGAVENRRLDYQRHRPDTNWIESKISGTVDNKPFVYTLRHNFTNYSNSPTAAFNSSEIMATVEEVVYTAIKEAVDKIEILCKC